MEKYYEIHAKKTVTNLQASIFFRIGNHIESNVRVYAALK